LASRRSFGNLALTKEEVRSIWGRSWVDDSFRDLRFAGRLLVRNRGFTAAAVIPLAFAVGCLACTATIADAILFRSLGMKQSDRIAAIYRFSREKNAFLPSTSYPDFRDVQSLGTLVEAAAAFARVSVNVRLSEAAEQMNSEVVTADYFRTTGIAPVIGRPLQAEDERPGAPPVALASYSLWQNRYGGSASALGSVAWIDGVAFTVVGVMPRGYEGTLLDWAANPSFWIPLPQIKQMLPFFARLNYENRREIAWLMTIVRLRPGVALGQLQAAVGTLANNLPGRRDVAFKALAADQARFFPGHWAATVRIVWVLVAVSAAALAIACFNLANLLLARSAARERETAARLALGAGRLRLLRQCITENVVLAGCACVLGLPMALGLTRAAQAFETAFGLTLNLNPDPRALAMSALAGLATAVLAGSAPAWTFSRVQLAGAMKGAAPGPVGRAAKLDLRDVFVAVQVACAMAAFTAAALLGQSMRKWDAIPLGYDPKGVLVGSGDTLSARIPEADRERIYRALLAELRTETRGAALAGQAMPTGSHFVADVMPDSTVGRWTLIDYNEVSDGYFELLRIPVVAGRDVLPEDDSRSRPVAIVNQAAARLFWPGQNPVGRHLQIRLLGTTDREVVGVVADARYLPLGDSQAALPIVFLPIFQNAPQVVAIHALTPGDPKSFIPALRRLVGRTVKDMPLSDLQTLEERVDAGMSQVRLVSQAIAAVGALGVLLALAGILASCAYRVAQRKREIAVRIAIGAAPGRVIRAFAARGIVLGLVGSVAGLLPAAWASELLRSSLRGVDAPGPFLFGASGVALALAAGAAAWAAARRIARIQPAAVLRVQ
jgi:predicted permease